MSFQRREVPALGREVLRLGLACNYGLDAKGFDEALERGVNYVFWTALKTRHLRASFRAALRRDRERLVVATGPSLGYFGGNVRSGCEKYLKQLGVDYLDVFHLFWLGVGSALTDGTLDALRKLKEEGKIRAIGVSIHDRLRAGALVADSPIDVFMIRYNAAHPGAEREVFPSLSRRQPAVVAYTATSWRRLLRAPSGWTGKVMSAGDCYRFNLSNPHVDLTLFGPGNGEHLREALAALERGPLTPEEEAWMRPFGRAVHG